MLFRSNHFCLVYTDYTKHFCLCQVHFKNKFKLFCLILLHLYKYWVILYKTNLFNLFGGLHMAIGDRIKRVRNLRGLTQKELGIAIGFDDKTADVRVAQYESSTRTPKEDMLKKIAETLDVNFRSIYEPTLYAAEDIMYTLLSLMSIILCLCLT